MLKVLMAASEASPFAKTGGLADVVGSLPAALKGLDVDARIILPKYGTIPSPWKERMVHKHTIFVPVD